IDASLGSSIVLGDNGVVNTGGDIFTTETNLGGDDVITSGANNTILGGFGADRITLGGGTNTVLGDNGIVKRTVAGTVTQVATTDTSNSTAGADVITSQRGVNIIICAILSRTIDASLGSNIVLGDNGVVNTGGDIFTTELNLGGDDIITSGATNTIL